MRRYVLLAAILLIPLGAQAESETPPCPTGLAGYVTEDGDAFMSWTVNSRSDIKVYKSVDGGDYEEIAVLEFPATRFIDHDLDQERSTRYQVAAVGLNQSVDDGLATEPESERCGTFEVAAVPFGAIPVLLAITGLAALVYARRR